MKRFLIIAAMSILLAGCSTLQSIGAAVGIAGSPVGSTGEAAAKNSAYALKSGYAAALVAMNAYGALPNCAKTANQLCFSNTIGAMLEKARSAAASAIATYEAAARSVTQDTTVLSAAESGAQAALQSFQQIITTYSLGST